MSELTSICYLFDHLGYKLYAASECCIMHFLLDFIVMEETEAFIYENEKKWLDLLFKLRMRR